MLGRKRIVEVSETQRKRQTTGQCELVILHRKVLPGLFDELWKMREQAVCASGVMFGMKWVSKTRRTLQFGAKAYHYTGSSSSSLSTTVPPVVQQLFDKTKELLEHDYNFALVTFYDTDGQLGWHADSEKEIDQRFPIVSWSFGTKARFAIKDTELFDYDLEDGDVLVMLPGCQEQMKHCVRKVVGPRVNVTLRMLK